MIARPPRRVGLFDPDFKEMCFYQYLPVKMANNEVVKIPQRLEPFSDMVNVVRQMAKREDHIYLTVKQGWASTENPLNRPGWHVDAFGHPEDRNFVWLDKFPTRYVLGDIGDVPEEDGLALKVFETVGSNLENHFVIERVLYEFDQSVVHCTPVIEVPGLRLFVKLSLSPHKYNLEGNSHNFLFDYDWRMYSREETRNDPVAGNLDYVKE